MTQQLQITLLVDVPHNAEEVGYGALEPAMHITQAFADDVAQYLDATVTQMEVKDLTPGGVTVGRMEAREGEDLRDRPLNPVTSSAEVGTFIWVCVYEHRHGMNTWAFTTPQAAEQHRISIAEQYWDAEIGNRIPRPLNAAEMAHLYFDVMSDHGEFYSIHHVELNA